MPIGFACCSRWRVTLHRNSQQPTQLWPPYATRIWAEATLPGQSEHWGPPVGPMGKEDGMVDSQVAGQLPYTYDSAARTVVSRMEVILDPAHC